MARFCIIEKNQINVEKCNSCNKPECGYNISEKAKKDRSETGVEGNNERRK